MQLAEIGKIVRCGSLIDARANCGELLAAVGKEALRVEQTDLEFVAVSAASAASWLLELANVNALGMSLHLPEWQPPPADRFRFSPNCLLGFRGQRGKYTTIIP